MKARDLDIVEALAAHVRIDETDRTLGYRCSCGISVDVVGPISGHRQHLAEVIEPIIREREAKAWEQGDNYGYAGAMSHAVPRLGNPYRTEATP